MHKLDQAPWTEHDVKMLKRLVKWGSSSPRAALALKRSVSSVQSKAIELGLQFPRWLKPEQSTEISAQEIPSQGG